MVVVKCFQNNFDFQLEYYKIINYCWVAQRFGRVSISLVISQANCMWPFSLATHGADDVLVIMHGPRQKKRPIDHQQRRQMNTAPRRRERARIRCIDKNFRAACCCCVEPGAGSERLLLSLHTAGVWPLLRAAALYAFNYMGRGQCGFLFPTSLIAVCWLKISIQTQFRKVRGMHFLLVAFDPRIQIFSPEQIYALLTRQKLHLHFN